MTDELKPCPFCGSTNLKTEDARDFVACGDCYTEGPCNPGMGSAANIEAWNRRAAAQPPAAMAVPPSAWIDDVMEQAQVFASAWSLVGGRFDFGRGLIDAVEAKAELRAMLAAAPTPQAQSVPATGAQPLALDVIREAKQDAMEVFDAEGPETPQTVRDVIEYMASWLEVYAHKRASPTAPTGSAG